jgi:hypothetical protein
MVTAPAPAFLSSLFMAMLVRPSSRRRGITLNSGGARMARQMPTMPCQSSPVKRSIIALLPPGAPGFAARPVQSEEPCYRAGPDIEVARIDRQDRA